MVSLSNRWRTCKKGRMGLFDFFKKKDKQVDPEPPNPTQEQVDKSQWTGKDFEFLITGDIDIPAEDYDNIMTPNSFDWTKTMKDEWPYYQVGQDEFSYSWEMPGIQMTFNKEMPYGKAKKIADEVLGNIKGTGQQVELVTLDKTKVYKF